MTKEFKDWLDTNHIEYEELNEHLLNIKGFGLCLFIQEKDGKICDLEVGKGRVGKNEFTFFFTDEEGDLIEEYDIKYLLFKWGSRYFYTKVPDRYDTNKDSNPKIEIKLNDFVNIGSFQQELDFEFVNLGIHTGYELLNGSCDADQYVDKAKFFKQKVLGSCEKNTLAGSLAFQISCKKKEIKSVLGYCSAIAYNFNPDKEHQDLYDLKYYTMNEEGWRNLLRINKHVNVDNEGFIIKKNLKKFSKGLICVVPPEGYLFQNLNNKKLFLRELKYLKSLFGNNLYFQLDFNEFVDDSIDIERLEKYKLYFKKYSKSIKPVYIPDIYYIEQRDSEVKCILNSIDRKSYPKSNEQYMKSVDDIFNQNIDFFNSSPELLDIFIQSIKNTKEIADDCNFSIDTGNHKLPKFDMSVYPDFDNEVEFYKFLIKLGFKEKIKSKFNKKKQKEYLKRIDIENDVIVNAGFVDYFLILWDIIAWAKENNILVGVGRGSVGGSLVAYLLGIIEIDPIKYGLLFERFLNKTRVSGERAKAADALPDIDIDFEGNRRDEVKQYIIDKYGYENICSVGTYSRLKVKSIIKDFARVKGVSFQEVNRITKQIDPMDKTIQTGMNFEDIYKWAVKKPSLKNFIQNNVDLFELIKSPINQQRSSSIHPSAVIITPKQDHNGNPMTIYDWMPVKKIDGILVSEWEGKYIDRAGFLKEDILGIAQLDKFCMIIDLIEKNTGQKIDLNEIPIDDNNTFELFQMGYNEDVFQFGTGGLKNYSKDVKPTTVEDLISMNALYRPGPMESGAHNDFVEIKHGKKKPKYDYGLEVVTKNTYGLYVYQEQVMQAVHVLGGLTLSEADELRTAIKKFDKRKMASFKKKFVKGAESKGCSVKEAKNIWDKLNAFSKYGFNRSHAAAYSVMGYWSQYLKVYYPLEFWTSSMNFVRRLEDYPNRLTEIRRINRLNNYDIKVQPADINKSDTKFVCDSETNNIYWSFSQIKQIGEKTAKVILDERKSGGEFFDLEEFLERVPKRQINKRIVINLILAGAFDELCLGINSSPRDRLNILKQYYKLIDSDIPEEYLEKDNKNNNFFWKMKQKDITGFAELDFEYLVSKHKKAKKYLNCFETSAILDESELEKKPVIMAGIPMYLQSRVSKTKSKWEYYEMTLDDGFGNIYVRMGKQNAKEMFKNFEELFFELKKDRVPVAFYGLLNQGFKHRELTHFFFGKERFGKERMQFFILD